MDREKYLEEHLNFLYGEEVDDPTSMYLDGGRASHEIVTQWYDFPDAEI